MYSLSHRGGGTIRLKRIHRKESKNLSLNLLKDTETGQLYIGFESASADDEIIISKKDIETIINMGGGGKMVTVKGYLTRTYETGIAGTTIEARIFEQNNTDYLEIKAKEKPYHIVVALNDLKKLLEEIA